MKRKLLILIVIIGGILVLSGLGVVAITNNIAMTMDNQPPSKPFITGPTDIPPGTYYFTFNSTDPDGDNVSYIIDWGDATSDETVFYKSGEELKVSHTYYEINSFIITSVAKDIHGLVGPEGTNPVQISRSKHIINLFFLELLEQSMKYLRILK